MEKSEYQLDDGRTFRREYGMTPNGNKLTGKWVLRDNKGKFIDFDAYRHDLANRHNIDLITPQKRR